MSEDQKGARATILENTVLLSTYQDAPDPLVVDACQRLLALAESGELRAIQYGVSLSGGVYRVATRGDWGTAISMMGCGALLQHHIGQLAIGVAESDG